MHLEAPIMLCRTVIYITRCLQEACEVSIDGAILQMRDQREKEVKELSMIRELLHTTDNIQP